MRPRTSCRAFTCQNGAPFGNPSSGSRRGMLGSAEWDRQGMTLLERIGAVEDASLRSLRLFQLVPLRYAGSIGAVCAAVCAVASNSTIRRVASSVATFLFSVLSTVTPVVLCSVAAGACLVHWPRWNGGPRIGLPRNFAQEYNRQVQSSFRWLHGFQTEDDQLAEAIARSLVEQ